MKLNPMTLHLTGDENSPDEGAPWWARFGYRAGIPSAAAVFLIWFLASSVTAELKAQRELLQEHNNSMMSQQRELLYVVRAICLIGAKDDSQRSLCTPPASEGWHR